jgi:hypothetical protein
MEERHYNNKRQWECNVPIGSIVELTIDNGDGGIGVVLRNDDNFRYKIYRITHGDIILVYSFEMYVTWSP